MCQECGCSQPAPYQIDGRPVELESDRRHQGRAAGHNHGHVHSAADPQPHTHGHEHGHEHGHDHEHEHEHEHEHSHHPARVVDVNAAILGQNDRLAEQNRGAFQALNLLALNVVSSPGSGKTTLLQATFERLGDRLRPGVIVGDLATDNDARRLRALGVPVVQISTGTLCHLEAGMVAQALKKLDLRSLDLVVIENVGNLVCPASFDLGESVRVVLLSVTEGEDKPLKYPPMFHSADVVIVTKTDLAEATGCDREALLSNLHRASPNADIFELSARSGDGMQAWCDYLLARRHAVVGTT